MRRAGTLVLATVALMSVVFAAGAAGHRAKVDTMVTAKFNKPTPAPKPKPTPQDPNAQGNFDGTVKSQKVRCTTNRTVKLRLRAADGSRPVVGTDLTDSAGAWVIQPTSPAAGTYFAQATRKVLRKNTKHRHVCRKAVSKDVTVK